MKITRVVFLGLLLLLPQVVAGQTDQVCNDAIIESSPARNFFLSKEGTAISKNTGLVWMRCSLGQTWDGKTCQGDASLLSWQEALNAAASFSYEGRVGWRLPNKNELESIVEIRCSAPAINETVFPATPSAFYWSSSPYAGVSDGAWSVDFTYGTVLASTKTGKIHVRLVRDRE